MTSIVKTAEKLFRHVLVYPTLRLLFRNPVLGGPIDLATVRKILILRYDRIGDIIVTTPVFRKLKESRPGLFLGVLASPSNAEIVLSDPHVDRIHVLYRNPRKLLKEIWNARRERYDVVLNFIFNRTTSGGILANLIAPEGIKVGQGAPKYHFYFNRLLSLERGSKHMVEVLAGYAEQLFGLKWNTEDLKMSVAVDAAAEASVDAELSDLGLARRNDPGLHYAVLNLSAGDALRKPTRQQCAAIARYLAVEKLLPVVLISSPEESGERLEVKTLAGGRGIHCFPRDGKAGLREIASLVGGAAFVVTPDTSIVHFASAMKTPVVALYTPFKVTVEWMPYGVSHRIIVAPDNQPVSAIDESLICRELSQFISEYTEGKGAGL